VGVRLAALVRRVRRDEPAGGSADADLLARFARARDEAAFELLVWRHGAMVLSACRRILHQTEDAEDAFQAVFLVLARKARGVSRGAALPAWLHRVAVRVALRLVRSRKPVAHLEIDPPAATGTDPAIQADTLGVLDEEIDRLPERHRAAVVLCYLEGLSAAEAGQRLGCPTGTVESRLAAARRRLRERLSGRGVTLPVGVLAMVVSHGVLAPEAIARLTRTSAAFARGEVIANETSVRLAKGVLNMWQARTWAGTFLVVAMLAVGTGFGWANWRGEPEVEPVAALPEAPAPQAKGEPRVPAKTDAWPFARRTPRVGGKLVGVAGDNRTLVVWEGHEVYSLDLTAKVVRPVRAQSANALSDAAVSPDGTYLATAEGVHGVKLRDAKTGEVLEALWPSGKLAAQHVAFTPDGKHLVALGTRYDDEARAKFGKGAAGFGDVEKRPTAKITVHAQTTVWDVAARKELGHPVETTTLNSFVANGPGAPRYALTDNGRFVFKHEFLLTERKLPSGAIRTAPAGLSAGSLPGDGEHSGFRFAVIDTLTGKAGAVVEVKDANLYSPRTGVLSPDGKTVVSQDVTKLTEIRLLDAATGKDRVKLTALLRPIKTFTFSPDGKYFAAASGLTGAELAAPSEVVIWDAATGKELARLADKESVRDYTALCFSPDGSFIVAQDEQGTYTLWGHPPQREPAKSPAKAPPTTPPAVVPDRFQTLFQTLAADGVTDSRRVEGVFLAALGRLPSEVESQTLVAQLARQTDKAAALRDLLNTLVGTAEFKAHAEALGKLAK
jgi:RNA polymerase sigma factor (sigma-70 family)